MRRLSVALPLLAYVIPGVAAPDEAAVKQVEVAGAQFPYAEAGQGEPVLFVHGAFADHRAWEPIREEVAQNFRFIAYTQREFGTSEWPEEPKFARDVHEADLVALLEAWGEPMHLVGYSYSGPIVLQAAMDRPDMVRRIVIFEPALPTVVEGKPEHEQALASYGAGWGPVAEAAKQGGGENAVQIAIEHVFGLSEGEFESLPAEARAMFSDNNHTVSKLLGAPPPTPMTCEDLGKIETPVLVLWGTDTLPFFEAAAKEVAACLPNARLEEIPGAGHGGPLQNRDDFLQKTMSFLQEANG